jgi:hypothetical protein
MSRNPSYLNENDFLDSPSLFYSNSDVKEVNNKELNILAAPKCVSNAISSNNEGRRALSDNFSG